MPRNEVASAKSTESIAPATSSLQLHIQRLEHQVALLNRELETVKSEASLDDHREFEIGLSVAGDGIQDVQTRQADNILHPVSRLSGAGLSPAVNNGKAQARETNVTGDGVNNIGFGVSGVNATTHSSPHVVAGDQTYDLAQPSKLNGTITTAGSPLFTPTKRSGASGVPPDSKCQKLKHEFTEQEFMKRIASWPSSKNSHTHLSPTSPPIPIKYDGYRGTYLVPPDDSRSNTSLDTE